jgi:hypothetical protein
MRTQPSTEETGAVRTQQLEATDEPGWQLALPKKNLCILTTGRLMGVTVIAEAGRLSAGAVENREAKIYVAKSSKASGKQHFAQCIG